MPYYNDRMPRSATEASALEEASAKQRDVLQGISSHAETESARLLAMLRRTEEATRQIAALEMQILRQEELHTQLQGELATLTQRKAEADQAARALIQERDGAKEDLAGADQAKTKLEAEVQQQMQSIKRLVKENDDLQREVEKLETRRARMEESVESLRRARDEYLAKIESLKAHHDALLK